MVRLLSRLFPFSSAGAGVPGLARGQLNPLVADIENGIAARRCERLSRPAPNEAKRFARAQPKVDQLRHEYAMRHVTF